MVQSTGGDQPSFTLGIEEEYFLVDAHTRALASELPRQLLHECRTVLGEHVSAEYQRSQIEVSTPVCTSTSEARAALAHSRKVVAGVARGYGLLPIAASTHPFASWATQRHTHKDRYNKIAQELQAVGRRMVTNGLHIHVGIEDDAHRIAIMNEIRGFLPLLLALSTSSPFWQGEDTGLKSYRTAINDATPRNGIPDYFENWNEYHRAVTTLVHSGVIEDATKVWWDLRPSSRFATLELRITDICPLIDDALCIAAVFRCLCRCLYRRSQRGLRMPNYPLLLLNENRWRAQRYGLECGFIDPSRQAIIASAALLDDLLRIIREDAVYFDCGAEVNHVHVILARGTSADRQLALYHQQGNCARALHTVVDKLIVETAGDTPKIASASAR